MSTVDSTNSLYFVRYSLSSSQCRGRVEFGTGVRQVNHSEAQGGQQTTMRLLKSG